MTVDDERWYGDNRDWWDEKVPLHVEGEFYRVREFLDGEEQLRPFELAELGDVAGRTLFHPQCHFGQDTLSWARHGARVTGLTVVVHSLTPRGLGDKLLASVNNGVNVIQMDLEKGLVGLEDGFFDHVIMSLSLQAMRNTQGILAEMLRVGREAVVSFPNFAYWRHRQAILNGRMPVSKNLPYQWYDTPNVRFFTIDDFNELCAREGILIREQLAFDEDKVIVEEPNFLASVALYRLARADSGSSWRRMAMRPRA